MISVLEFPIHILSDILDVKDLIRLSMTCNFCKNVINRIISYNDVNISNEKFQYSINYKLGDTQLRIPILTRNLYQMKQLKKLDTLDLLQQVDYFYITYNSSVEVKYNGHFIPVNPRYPGTSTMDVCCDSGQWKTSTFLRYDGEYIIFCYNRSQKEQRLHCMSPRLTPPYYQISGGGVGIPYKYIEE